MSLSRVRARERYQPQAFGAAERVRFESDRLAHFIERLGGEPDSRQAALIDEMIGHEWQARRLEAQALNEIGSAAHATMRLAADYRRLYRLADRDLDRAPRKQPPHPTAHPVEAPSLAEHLAAKAAASR
jgi:hypothetical protein